MRIQQTTLARLADIPRSVVVLAAVAVLAGIYLVVVPVTWAVTRLARAMS